MQEHVPSVVESLMSEEGEGILQTRKQEEVEEISEPQELDIGVV